MNRNKMSSSCKYSYFHILNLSFRIKSDSPCSCSRNSTSWAVGRLGRAGTFTAGTGDTDSLPLGGSAFGPRSPLRGRQTTSGRKTRETSRVWRSGDGPSLTFVSSVLFSRLLFLRRRRNGRRPPERARFHGDGPPRTTLQTGSSKNKRFGDVA